MRRLLLDKDLIYGITDETITLKEISSKEAKPIIIAHHYSHKATPNHFISMSVNENKGILQLGYGIRPHKKNTISPLITKENYCEFDRMWLSDELPKFSESKTIGLLLRYLKAKYKHIKFVITYADGSAGNVGTIYKATNAIPLKSKDVDFYVLENGERVHPVTMWHRHGTRTFSKLKEIYPNIIRIRGGKIETNRTDAGIEQYRNARQYKFLYILDKRLKKEFLKNYEKPNNLL